MAGTKAEVLQVDGHEVTVTNPGKVFFPARGQTKLDLVRYYVELAEQVLVGVRGRPMQLKRHPDGAQGEFFYQKRAPASRPAWIETCQVRFPSGRAADLVVCRSAADLAWVANLGCIDLHPWPVRTDDTDHPDELRVDLDPTPESSFDDVRQVAAVTREVLAEHGLAGFPKTSGSRGIHLNCRIRPEWEFLEVRRAGLALARAVERRIPELASSAWWKEERHGVFMDYNQNARDRTVASVYSVRPKPDARVSCALAWDELHDADPAELRMDTVPERVRRVGDPGAAIDRSAGGLESLLELAARDERDGLGDAPWPPHFPKAEGEATRVAPSRARKPRRPGS
jgi:bifunctional non-homologous end joining protein LigD